MNDDADSERLLAIASAIAKGDRIGWDDESRQIAGTELELLGALQAIESIADAQRRIQKSPAAALTHWGHLTIIGTIREGPPWAWYRARDPGLSRDVFLLLAGPLSGDPATVERLLKDARRQTQLHHPHIATAYGADYAQDHVGLWMEAVPGPTLEEWVRSRGPLDAAETAAIVHDLSAAVDAFHRAGLTHGAVTPAHAIRCEDGRIVLSASLAAGAEPSADIAGLGATLQFLLGRVPRRLAPVVARALASDPVARFATAADLDAALQQRVRAARVGWEWVMGLVVAAILAGLIMWLTGRPG